jgi:hypothetical protein
LQLSTAGQRRREVQPDLADLAEAKRAWLRARFVLAAGSRQGGDSQQ